MKKFTDLLLFEINRIKKAYLMLIGLIVSLQIVANIWASNNFMRIYKHYLKETRGSMNDFLYFFKGCRCRLSLIPSPYRSWPNRRRKGSFLCCRQ